jgi:hypothetical protein
VQGRAALAAVEGAAHRHAVDRDLLRRVSLVGSEHRPHPAEGAALERVRVEEHEDLPERVVRGNAVRRGQDLPEPALLAAAVPRAVLEALGLAEDGAHRDHQDIEQPVHDLPAAAWILDRRELGDQGFEHGRSPPSGKAEP